MKIPYKNKEQEENNTSPMLEKSKEFVEMMLILVAALYLVLVRVASALFGYSPAAEYMPAESRIKTVI